MRESALETEGKEIVREEKKGERHFPSRSPMKQRLKRVGARNKVSTRDESYAWVPETAGFVSFQKVEVSPTRVISYLGAM